MLFMSSKFESPLRLETTQFLKCHNPRSKPTRGWVAIQSSRKLNWKSWSRMHAGHKSNRLFNWKRQRSISDSWTEMKRHHCQWIESRLLVGDLRIRKMSAGWHEMKNIETEKQMEQFIGNWYFRSSWLRSKEMTVASSLTEIESIRFGKETAKSESSSLRIPTENYCTVETFKITQEQKRLNLIWRVTFSCRSISYSLYCPASNPYWIQESLQEDEKVTKTITKTDKQ